MPLTAVVQVGDVDLYVLHDLAELTLDAIDRIEVLRDGAAAQYGSDAIAGVINVQLRKSVGNRAQATFGKYITSVNDVFEQGGPVLGANNQPVLDANGNVLQQRDPVVHAGRRLLARRRILRHRHNRRPGPE